MIKPHGGRLVNRILTGEKREKEIKEAKGFFRIKLRDDLLRDVENIAKGVFSPIEGFLAEKDLLSVLSRKRLAGGIPWTIPIVLDVTEEEAKSVKSRIALDDEKGRLIATMEVEDKYGYNKEEIAELVFGTGDSKHPGVAKVLGMKDVLIGGKINLVNEVEVPFKEYALSPVETRKYFEEKGWKTVVGFQTRNIPHIGHEYVQKSALTFVDGLFINPVIGKKKKGDFKDEVILDTYETLIKEYFPGNNVKLATLMMEMRYAGPREAIFHAIIRQNFGCTHFIVGRDHAGVGDYYHPFAAHEIFNEFPELEIKPLFFRSFFFCRKCSGVANEKTCPHDNSDDRINFSGTNIRELLLKGKVPQKELMRPEVAKIILKYKEPFVE